MDFKKRNLAVLTLGSLAGFAIGGAIGGAIWVTYDAPHIGFAVMGAIGGATLIALTYGWRKAWITAIFSAVGYDIGLLAGFFIPLAIWEPGNASGLLVGVIGGAVGGASTGASLKSWRKTGYMALESAIGFGLAAWLTWDSFRGMNTQILSGILALCIWGAGGGLCMGFTLGWLEKRNA